MPAMTRGVRTLGAVAGVLALLASATRLAAAEPVRFEPGDPAWLRYESIDDSEARARYDALPATVVALGESPLVTSARSELVRGVRGLLGRTLREEASLPREPAVVLGRVAALRALFPSLGATPELSPDGFWLKTVEVDGQKRLLVAAPDDRGVLYGTFALLRKIALREPVASLDVAESPRAPVRWVNEWDNLDGTIERGYAGRSIFFEQGRVVEDLSRAGEYARLLASVGVNGCAISNVNADARLLTAELLPQVGRVAEAFRPWGVGLALSIDFSSPKIIGGLDTFDPLDPRVAAWWKTKVDEVYRSVPDLAGFVLKADSEGRLGPAAYGRTHADAANVIARALKPHGGLIFYRGFVYDHHMDWRNPKNDRARAAYDNFQKLDGLFDDNVVIQIKHGPIDFQVREPASPLFGSLEKTNDAVELQITQEYLGQQRHLCYIVPMWKTVLDFDMAAARGGSPVKELVAGRTFHRPTGGFVGVANVGREATWLGHPLAMANLYGFGRLAWDADLSARRIAEEWTRLTFGHDPKVVETIVDMQLQSWPAYEAYTGPLGAGTLTDILGPHYGPGIESSERNGWGQWHRADHDGIGMDRTVATGTGYIGQYRPPVAAAYESLATCPDELLLFMHHVPYTHVLHSGKTVIQHIYDSHYDGAAMAAAFVGRWEVLRGRIDPLRFGQVLDRLEYQAGHARVWRDAICSWFLRMSEIPDDHGRAGRFPGRIEAEAMALEGYAARDVTPWETASGGKDAECVAPSKRCAASFVFDGSPGWHDVAVAYFDENDGASRFRLAVGGQVVDEWRADGAFPTAEANGHSSVRRLVRGLALRPGDRVRIEAEADGGENAPVDYVEIDPKP
jgi:alpha-glucuronidase